MAAQRVQKVQSAISRRRERICGSTESTTRKNRVIATKWTRQPKRHLLLVKSPPDSKEALVAPQIPIQGPGPEKRPVHRGCWWAKLGRVTGRKNNEWTLHQKRQDTGATIHKTDESNYSDDVNTMMDCCTQLKDPGVVCGTWMSSPKGAWSYRLLKSNVASRWVQALNVMKLRVGWLICFLSILQQPEVCFRCFNRSHKSFSYQGPDRTNLWWWCGGASDKVLKYLLCSGKPNDKNIMGGST